MTSSKDISASRKDSVFFVADTQLFMRLCPSVCRGDRVKKWKNECFGYFSCMFVYGVGFGVWMGVGCPCTPAPQQYCHLSLVLKEQLMYFKNSTR